MSTFSEDLKIIKKKRLELLYDNYFLHTSDKSAEDLIQSPSGTYYFPDIDYNCDNMYIWNNSDHYIALECDIIKSGNERIVSDPVWRNKIIGAIRFWLENDFICPNWWHNQIHMPRIMLNLALLLDGYLPDDVCEAMEKLILRGSYKNLCYNGEKEIPSLDYDKKSRAHPYDWDGTNLLWSAEITILHAVWTKDEKLLNFAIERLLKEIKYTVGSGGVQKDGAFCLHGVRWYSGGYGSEFVFDGAPLIYILGNTSFALPEEKMNVFLTNILDGQRAMMRNGYFDFNCLGRIYAAPNRVFSGNLIPAVKLIASLENIPRKEEVIAFYNEISQQKENYEITKFYESVCQLCHKKDGVYIGVRGRTEGIRGGEGYPAIGFLGYNTTYGTLTCYMESGEEYYNIAPFLDYTKWPGTTAREESESDLQNHGDWNMEKQTDCFAIGASFQDKAVLAEKAVHDGISLQTTFFVFSNVLVALGTDIMDITPEKGKLFTTIEQCRAKDVVIERNIIKRGSVFYKNLGNTDFIADFSEKEGSWKRNYLDGDDKILKDNILTITIPVTSGDSYAYMVYKDNQPQIEILRNDKDCQAILIDGKTLMAAFHREGELVLNDTLLKGKKNEIIVK